MILIFFKISTFIKGYTVMTFKQQIECMYILENILTNSRYFININTFFEDMDQWTPLLVLLYIIGILTSLDNLHYLFS